MLAGTLSRYFGLRFLKSVVGSFFGVVALAAMIDYVELMRRSADWPNATAWLLAEISMFRVPQLTERIMPFAVLVGAMSCYLTLSRRLELVVARAAGVSAWQFVAPAMIAAFLFGTVATTLYNPARRVLHERSKRLEAEMMGGIRPSAMQSSTSGFWVRQKSADGAAIINANFEPRAGRETRRRHRLHLRQRRPLPGADRGKKRDAGARLLAASKTRASMPSGKPPEIDDSYRLATNLTLEQVRESFATPETVPFWQLPSYIDWRTGRAHGRRRLSAAIPAAAVASFPARRHGFARRLREPALLPLRRRAEDGAGGISAGFLLFVLSKFTEDMSKSELMSPVAWRRGFPYWSAV
jgi:lipopolysaccharide export system permease protein